MIPPAPVCMNNTPICRCPHCGMRWVVARVPHPEEHDLVLYCVACSREWRMEQRMEDGKRVTKLVPITYTADALTEHDRAITEHAARNVDGMLRRRTVPNE